MEHRLATRALLILDPTCHRAGDLSATVDELACGAEVVVAVLWPPPTLTLSVRAMEWQHQHRSLTSRALAEKVRRDVVLTSGRRDLQFDADVRNLGRSLGRSPGRVVDAIGQLRAVHTPDVVILQPSRSGFIDHEVCRRVESLLPDKVVRISTTPSHGSEELHGNASAGAD